MVDASASIVASFTILSRLRSETRGEHVALEEALDLMSVSLTADAYRHRLGMFYGFYAPLEAALRLHASDLEIRSRLNKTALLHRDLAYLGVLTEYLPLCGELPSVQTKPEVLGCMYVIEGATLGGRIITKHAQSSLGIEPDTGGSFFQGYGDETAGKWIGMRQLLVNTALDGDTENAIVANAIATFASLRCWYQSGQSRERH
jgi:heme oxygenase (biliverdin-IX-beta and delta-forming)